MSSINEKAIEKLNHLIAIANDGKYGYENAAGDVSGRFTPHLDGYQIYPYFRRQGSYFKNMHYRRGGSSESLY